MKRILTAMIVMAAFSFSASAQKFALVDMEYILKNIPAYEMANEQLNQVSLRTVERCVILPRKPRRCIRISKATWCS